MNYKKNFHNTISIIILIIGICTLIFFIFHLNPNKCVANIGKTCIRLEELHDNLRENNILNTNYEMKIKILNNIISTKIFDQTFKNLKIQFTDKTLEALRTLELKKYPEFKNELLLNDTQYNEIIKQRAINNIIGSTFTHSPIEINQTFLKQMLNFENIQYIVEYIEYNLKDMQFDEKITKEEERKIYKEYERFFTEEQKNNVNILQDNINNIWQQQTKIKYVKKNIKNLWKIQTPKKIILEENANNSQYKTIILEKIKHLKPNQYFKPFLISKNGETNANYILYGKLSNIIIGKKNNQSLKQNIKNTEDRKILQSYYHSIAKYDNNKIEINWQLLNK